MKKTGPTKCTTVLGLEVRVSEIQGPWYDIKYIDI